MNITAEDQWPRPNPRFTGFETLVYIGAEKVAKGLSEGDVAGVAVGAVVLIAAALGGLAWRRWGSLITQGLRRCWSGPPVGPQPVHNLIELQSPPRLALPPAEGP